MVVASPSVVVGRAVQSRWVSRSVSVGGIVAPAPALVVDTGASTPTLVGDTGASTPALVGDTGSSAATMLGFDRVTHHGVTAFAAGFLLLAVILGDAGCGGAE